MNCLVTGGAGFIGSHLVDALLDLGARVTVVDNLSTGSEENLAGALSRGAELRTLDVREPASMTAEFQSVRPELVFHLAAQLDVRYSVEHPAQDAVTNVLGTIAVLPSIFINQFGFSANTSRALGGTSVLIVVGVALDTMRQMESQMMMRSYEGFLR